MDKHLDKLNNLLHKELEYVRMEQTRLLSRLSPSQLQSRGMALLNLRNASIRTGLGGKLIVELVPRTGKTAFPPHLFKTGDVVRVEGEGGREMCTGVIYKIKGDSLEVALRGGEEEMKQCEVVRVTKLANETAFERQFEAIKMIDINDDIVQLSWERKELSFEADKASSMHPFFDSSLNDAQRRAVQNCVRAKRLALIHGPPGTGKTATLVEVIRQLKRRLLVCGPSNLSVDNLIERLSSGGGKLRMTRLGHPARMLPSVLPYSLDYQLVEEGQVIGDIRREIQEALRQVPASRERKKLYQEMRMNRKELSEREHSLTMQILRNSDVVLCTLNMSGSRIMKDLLKEIINFDVVVIDEGSQSMEPETWIAARHAKKLIIAGDHLQLPPTVTCPEVASDLGKTLFERLIGMYPREPVYNLLDTQYRMHKDIMNWSNMAMYEGRLRADACVATHRLCDLDNVVNNELTCTPIVFYDTIGCDMLESLNDDINDNSLDVESRSNEGEARICIRHLNELLASGLRHDQIAIITPYNAQVSLIKSLLGDGSMDASSLEIGSVDGFQGREKEAIIFSFVRSNDSGELGFLSDTRRTNVAWTRARRQLCVVGDSGTLERHPFYKQLIEYLQEHADVRFPS